MRNRLRKKLFKKYVHVIDATALPNSANVATIRGDDRELIEILPDGRVKRNFANGESATSANSLIDELRKAAIVCAVAELLTKKANESTRQAHKKKRAKEDE